MTERPATRLPLGKRQAYGLALTSGVLYFLGFPGIDLWPVSFVALVPLILALEGQTTKRCTGLGWVAGMGMTVCGFYWLREMLATFSQIPEPGPTAFMVILCGYQSGRIALCGFLYGRAATRGHSPPLVFAGAFAVSELLYPLLFPWFYGASVHNALPLLQVADLGGPILVGLVLVAPNLAIAHLLSWRFRGAALDRRVLVVGALVPAVAAGYGLFRISRIEALDQAATPVKVALIQGNQPLLERDNSLAVHKKLTKAAKEEGAELVIWSEAIVQADLREDAYQWQVRKRMTWNLGVPTIVGTIISKRNPEGHPLKWTDYNSAVMTNDKGAVVSRYDKQFLLMFGEYLPFGETFPKLYELSPNSSAFTRGTSLEPLMFGDKRLATTICYEDILPPFFNDMVRHAKPDLLVNLTNDGWFGDTTEPWIHLALAKLRTVEHRRYLVRSTNSGVSAIVDATGRVVAHGGTFTEETVLGDVRFLTGGTVYQVLGDKPWWLLALVMAALGIVRHPRSPKPPPPDREEDSAEGADPVS